MRTSYRHLMLIDDDEDDRDFFMQVMEDIHPGMVYDTASNGRLALDKLNSGIRPDLIFLDLNMPLMSGQQFLQEIRNHKHLVDIPVVILSTSADAQTIRETLSLGARHFITKPDLLQGWKSALKDFFDDIGKILK